MSSTRERVLITGCAGFIGSHLARHLTGLGHPVAGLIKPGQRAPQGIRGFAVDLNDAGGLKQAVANSAPDWIFHLAASTRRTTSNCLSDMAGSVENDLLGFLHLAEAIEAADARPSCLIRTGSLAEYGAQIAPFAETQREQPLDSYAAALVAGTNFAEVLGRRVDFPVITARLSLTYGMGQSAAFLIPSLFENCRQRRETHLQRPADRRDLIHVSDVTDALKLIAKTAPRDLPIVNIATGIAPSVQQIALKIARLTGCPPELIVPGDANLPSTGIPDFRARPDLARTQLGWQARIKWRDGLSMLARTPPQPGGISGGFAWLTPTLFRY